MNREEFRNQVTKFMADNQFDPLLDMLCSAEEIREIGKETFDDVNTFYEQLLRVKDVDSCACVLCGNKCDLSSERQVSTEEGNKLAESKGFPFFETSAKDNINVDEAFIALGRLSILFKGLENNDNGAKTPKKRKGKCIIC